MRNERVKCKEEEKENRRISKFVSDRSMSGASGPPSAKKDHSALGRSNRKNASRSNLSTNSLF